MQRDSQVRRIKQGRILIGSVTIQYVCPVLSAVLVSQLMMLLPLLLPLLLLLLLQSCV